MCNIGRTHVKPQHYLAVSGAEPKGLEFKRHNEGGSRLKPRQFNLHYEPRESVSLQYK